MPSLENSLGDKGGTLSTCVWGRDWKVTENNRLFEHICPVLVLKNGGFRLTFYRNMPNSSSAILNHGIVDKSKPDLKRSVNLSLGHKGFSPQTLTKGEPLPCFIICFVYFLFCLFVCLVLIVAYNDYNCLNISWLTLVEMR